ncbi:MAG TPA: LCP family protein [Acidimicrobiales bacterium]
MSSDGPGSASDGAASSPDGPARSPTSVARRRRRTWPQRIVLLAGILATLAFAGSAASLAYLYRKIERLPRVELSGVLERERPAGEPGNYLVVGVDNAERLDPDDPVRIGRDDLSRSDTIMIVRIEDGDERARLLSLPRDLWVPAPGTGGSQRINSLVQRGGPELLIRGIREYLGIPINHYVQVDFAAFRDLVDAIGGVPVYFPYPARDLRSGLRITEAGCTTLGPTEALAYVRSRYYEERIDGEWVDDPQSDLSRIQRQQDFIRRALSRAVSRARNPGTLDQLIDVGLDGIVVDDALTSEELYDLGQRFSSFDPDDLVTYSPPVTEDEVGGADVLRLDEDGAERILSRFRPDTGSEDVAPESVRLRVENGSGITGQAGAVARELATVGFGIRGTADGASFGNERTVIEHGPGQAEAADAVARWLVAGAELRETDTPGIVLVTGADWAGVRSEPVPPPTDDSGAGTGGGSTDGSARGDDEALEGFDDVLGGVFGLSTTEVDSGGDLGGNLGRAGGSGDADREDTDLGSDAGDGGEAQGRDDDVSTVPPSPARAC